MIRPFLFSFFLLVGGLIKAQPLVHFQWGAVELPENRSDAARAKNYSDKELIDGRYFRLFQTLVPLDESQRALAEKAGLHIGGYLPDGVYLASLVPETDFNALDKLPWRSLTPLPPEWKYAQSLREKPWGDWAVHGDLIDLNVQVFPDVDKFLCAGILRETGANLLYPTEQSAYFQINIHRDKIDAVAALPFVQSLELPPPPAQMEDTRSRSLIRSSTLDSEDPNGLHFNGADVKVLVRDDGRIGPHADFKNRLVNFAYQFAGAAVHGDAVAGLIGGAGNIDPTKKGAAAGAIIYTIDLENEFQDQTLLLHLKEGISITNNSFSNGCNIGYTLGAQNVDRQLFDYPELMHVFSAGNNGGTNCNYGAGNEWGNITGGHKMAKNALVCANVDPVGLLDNGSSRGPASDGRLKPDLSANGTGTQSTSINNQYIGFGGTSGAAAGISGLLAQLTQAFTSTFPFLPLSYPLLKTALLNTAYDLGNSGPDFKFGWGLADGRRAWELLKNQQYGAITIHQGEINSLNLTIPPNTLRANVMMYWSDPPGNVLAKKALVNDLDLTVSKDPNTVFLPWTLNHLPNAVTLNLPAIKGRDSLNNVEQVTIEQPAAGAYSIHVKGQSVPLGPQTVYLAWDFLTDDIRFAWPKGGEAFVPGEKEIIHWEAFGNSGDFTLEYSLNNGQVWLPLAIVPAEKRTFEWTIPATETGKANLRLGRNGQLKTCDTPFSIVKLPEGLVVDKVCPDSMYLSWKDGFDTLEYEVFGLGEKYMESLAKTPNTSVALPVVHPEEPRWLAIRAIDAGGLRGRRTKAVEYPGGLSKCPQGYDASINYLLTPTSSLLYDCGPVSLNVSVELVNQGTEPLGPGFIRYRLGQISTISEPAPSLMPGEKKIFTFTTPQLVSARETLELKVWTDYTGENYRDNDTLRQTVTLVSEPVPMPVVQDFDDLSYESLLPVDWPAINPDGRVGFTKLKAPKVIGSDGETTDAVYLDCFNYNQIGETDYLYFPPVEISGTGYPVLEFDLAHAGYDGTTQEILRVELIPECADGQQPIKVWEKSDPALSTAGNDENAFFPRAANHWRRETVNLSAFKGKTAAIRFAAVNGFGNSVFIDNIRVEDFSGLVPNAEFAAVDTLCRLDTTYFTPTVVAPNTTYKWTFGAQASPTSAQGPGPHAVRYLTAGQKTVRLIAQNNIASDTVLKMLTVRLAPLADFGWTTSDLTAFFVNGSANADTWLWDFGDGQFSSLAEPQHTWAIPGQYSVKLTAESDCGLSEKTQLVTLISGTHYIGNDLSINLGRNTVSGEYFLTVAGSTPGPLNAKIFDSAGKNLSSLEWMIHPGDNVFSIDLQSLPPGVYHLKISSEKGGTVLPLLKY